MAGYKVLPLNHGFCGEVKIPGDKSISHRSIIFSGLGDTPVEITNFLTGEDCFSTINCMKNLGVKIKRDGNKFIVKGKGMDGLREPANILDAGNSGTTLSLLLGLTAPQKFFVTFTGDSSLRERPMGRVINPLTKMGAKIFGRGGDKNLPVCVAPAKEKLHGINYQMPVASAQVKSALILSALYAQGKTKIIEPAPSRDHTEKMLLSFGADIEKSGNEIIVTPTKSLILPRKIYIPGDISSAAYWIVLATICKNSDVTLKNVGVNPTRTGILDVMKKMGAKFELLNERTESGEPIADIRVVSSNLRGVEIDGEIIPRLIDEIPVIAVAAAFAEGETIIHNVGELRVKESNRLEAIIKEFNKISPDSFFSSENTLIIRGGREKKFAECSTLSDHRMAMSLAIFGAAAEGVLLDDADCIKISYPHFFYTLEITEKIVALSNAKKVIAIDGPAGAGKSSVSKIVAERIGYTHIDTGAMYRAVALKVFESGEPVTEKNIVRQVNDIEIKLDAYGRVFIGKRDVTDEIRTPEVTRIASFVAKNSVVRKKLTEMQRQMAKKGAVVMDGRDIGTTVLPNADVKIFLTAEISERARRRYRELLAKGVYTDFNKLEKEVSSRDKQDREREISPLARAEDAILLDSTGIPLDDVVKRILEIAEEA